jgi:hypothetical protein
MAGGGEEEFTLEGHNLKEHYRKTISTGWGCAAENFLDFTFFTVQAPF